MPNNASLSDFNTIAIHGQQSARHRYEEPLTSKEARSEGMTIAAMQDARALGELPLKAPTMPKSHTDSVMVDTMHLPSATADAMETYENIQENIYCGNATGRSIASESMPCECKYDPDFCDPSEACGDDNICINRMMFMECVAEHCPCDRYCRNRRFQLRQYARVDVIRTEKKGYGLRALTDLPTNAFVMEYIGEVIPYNEFIRRTRVYEKEGVEHYYFMTLKNDEIIDATRKGCLARFINHSCNPNCVTQKWVIGKTMRIGLFTMRSIKAGEELTFDYKFERFGATAQACYCGESNCKGFIGGSATQDDEDLVNQAAEEAEDEEAEELDVMLPKKIAPRNRRKTKAIQPLHDVDQVQSFVKKMLDSISNAALVNKLLDRLDLTNPENSVGKDVLKRFVRLHGLKMLKCWLSEWKHDDRIILKVIRILSKLPLANRNGLDDCKMFDVVRKLAGHENREIDVLSAGLLSNWSELKEVYRIPKRVFTEGTTGEPTEAGKGTVLDQQEGVLVEKATVKKPKYGSTREFFDPDDDFYEYVPFDSQDADISCFMRYPPCPAIPTAPRAMLEYTAMMSNDSYSWYQYPTYNYYDNTYPGCYVIQDIQYAYMSSMVTEQYQHTAQAQAEDTAATPTTTTTTAAITTTTVTGSDPYSQTYDTPITGDGPDIAAAAAAAAASTVMVNGKRLPLDWQKAMTDTGQVYYYNITTKVSQWELPEEKIGNSAAVVGISSVEGVDKGQLDDLVKQAVHRKRQQTSSTSSANSVSADQPPRVITPAASTNGSNEVEESGMDEVELKREIGKVVTKYLTVKHQALWNGDKYLFKELARKLTHHVVDRELHSKRKMQSMTSQFRAKIEKFIDLHGSDFVLKIHQSRHS